ncbi:hypothetical protein C2S51_021719 [Perilla frutescens var. frutescens]|nr:hypothetical protein C2S51_021719 [Perilla frutescens var. frutescens]
MSSAEEVKFSLKVMINKEKTKVLFAEADSHFTDILLSFLTLPLGRVVKILEKHYGDEAPTIGSLSTLYHSLANLDSAHFWTEGAKLILLNPTSSFEAEYESLKLDISDSPPANYFFCNFCDNRFRSVSMYYDQVIHCFLCGRYSSIRKEEAKMGAKAAASDVGTFTKNATTFIITDDLLISTYMTGLLETISILGITDMDSAKLINVSFGLSEIMNLLKASLISQTPLSDLILSSKRQMNSITEKSKPEASSHQVGEEEEAPNSKKMVLKVMVQKSTGKFLYAQAREDFVELIFSFLIISFGEVECLLEGKTCIKSIDNLYRSIADLIDDECFKTSDTKSRLIKPKLPDGYISKDHVLPLDEEGLPSTYRILFSSTKFPKGQGIYINGPKTYHVTDDLTVTPFSIAPVISSLSELKIPMSDVKGVEVQIGLEEALSILKASLTSKSALTNGLRSHIISNKQPKPEI